MQGDTKSVDEYLNGLPAWQAKNLHEFRKLVHAARPDVVEEIKWSVPVFIYKSKIVFSMASFKAHTKYNFMLNGALLEDPKQLFNNGLESKKSRSIDLQEGETVDKSALQGLIEQSVGKL